MVDLLVASLTDPGVAVCERGASMQSRPSGAASWMRHAEPEGFQIEDSALNRFFSSPARGANGEAPPASGSVAASPELSAPKFQVGSEISMKDGSTGTVTKVDRAQGMWLYTIVGDRPDQVTKKKKKTTWGCTEADVAYCCEAAPASPPPPPGLAGAPSTPQPGTPQPVAGPETASQARAGKAVVDTPDSQMKYKTQKSAGRQAYDRELKRSGDKVKAAYKARLRAQDWRVEHCQPAKRASPHEKRRIEFYKERIAGLKIDRPNAKHCDLVKEVAVMWKETQCQEGDSSADGGVLEVGLAPKGKGKAKAKAKVKGKAKAKAKAKPKAKTKAKAKAALAPTSGSAPANAEGALPEEPGQAAPEGALPGQAAPSSPNTLAIAASLGFSLGL